MIAADNKAPPRFGYRTAAAGKAPQLAGVAAAAVLIALLGANWYAVDYDAALGGVSTASASAWTVMHGADYWIALLAGIAALGLVLNRRDSLFVALGAALGAAGLVAYHLIDLPADLDLVAGTVSLQAGAWLALLAALVLAGAAALGIREGEYS